MRIPWELRKVLVEHNLAQQKTTCWDAQRNRNLPPGENFRWLILSIITLLRPKNRSFNCSASDASKKRRDRPFALKTFSSSADVANHCMSLGNASTRRIIIEKHSIQPRNGTLRDGNLQSLCGQRLKHFVNRSVRSEDILRVTEYYLQEQIRSPGGFIVSLLLWERDDRPQA